MPKHIAFLVTEDWYFRQHFLALAKAAQKEGYRVSLLCHTGEKGLDSLHEIQKNDISVYGIDFKRSSINPIYENKTRKQILSTYRKIRPDIVHHIALKPILYGQYAARLAGIKVRVNLLPGFGYIFTSGTIRATFLRWLVSYQLMKTLNNDSHGLITLNKDDQNQLAELLKISPDLILTIPGTGVDLDRFEIQPESTPEHSERVIVTFLGRFLRDKGLDELAEAARIIKARSLPVHIRLVGSIDPSNPSSFKSSDLQKWESENLFEINPWTNDVPLVWSKTNIAILPSHREGFGMSLAEAAATRRALIATDVTGCRDAVIDGKSGLLIPPHDPLAIANAIEKLAVQTNFRKKLAVGARQDAENRLSVKLINNAVISLYAKLLKKSF